MWDKTKRAFDVMKERNRRYIEEQGKKDEAERKEEAEQREEDEEESEELRQAKEKLRAYREANGLDPTDRLADSLSDRLSDRLSDSLADGPDGEDRAEAYRKANNEAPKLEKGDVPAMILSAFIVFGPIFLVLFGILLLAWIFLH